MKSLIHHIHRLTQKVGYDFRRYSKENFVAVRRAHLLRRNEIDVVVDVGAHTGTFGTELREEGYGRRIVSLEPLADSFARLQRTAAGDRLWHCENLALGDNDSCMMINVSGRSSSSSLLGIAHAHVDAMKDTAYVRQEKIRVARLDSLRDQLFTQSEHLYLKIDVQGFEKHVLSGAQATLAQVRCLELEMSLVPLYESGPLYREIIEDVDRLGFDLVSLENVFIAPDTGHVLQVDGIFERRKQHSGGLPA